MMTEYEAWTITQSRIKDGHLPYRSRRVAGTEDELALPISDFASCQSFDQNARYAVIRARAK